MFCLSAMSHIMNEAKSIPLNMLLRHISQMREQITEMESELGVVRDDIMKAETAMGGIEARTAAVMDAVDVSDAFFERQTARLGLAVDLPRGWTLADKHRASAALVSEAVEAAPAPEPEAAAGAAPAPEAADDRGPDRSELWRATASAAVAAVEAYAAAVSAAAAARSGADDVRRAAVTEEVSPTVLWENKSTRRAAPPPRLSSPVVAAGPCGRPTAAQLSHILGPSRDGGGFLPGEFY